MYRIELKRKEWALSKNHLRVLFYMFTAYDHMNAYTLNKRKSISKKKKTEPKKKYYKRETHKT